MKYEYTISQSHDRDGHYYAGPTTCYDFAIKTDGYLLYMTINNLSGINPEAPKDLDYDYQTMRRRFSNENELTFTGGWGVITNDSDKSDVKLYVEVLQEYIMTIKESFENQVEVTGWRRLFGKYKTDIEWKDKEIITTKSKAWISEDSFKFRSLFNNECGKC